MNTVLTYERVPRSKKKINAEKRRENTKKIIEISAEAKKQGMSYGQYVAKMGL